jgi:hypothetical protein
MVIIHFEDAEMEKKALGFLAGRCSFKTWANGDLIVSRTGGGQTGCRRHFFSRRRAGYV